MKRIANRGLALLMAVLMCISFLAVPGTHNHAHAADFEYRYSTDGNSYIYNWGSRGEAATSLSPNALAFYTGDSTYTNLSQLPGGTGVSDAPNSALYSGLKTLMSGKQTYVTTYNDTRDMFQYTDCQNSGNPSSISSFYSGAAIGPVWDSGATWNREHTWPNSKGDASGEGENDIMMLRPTATSENSSRGNKAYGESSGYYNPNTVSGGNYDLRGDVARITLFVYTRWGNTVSMWGSSGVMESLDILLKWMQEDPVDTWELGRNDSVESITGTRNVYVDYPELAFLLFGKEIPADLSTPSNGQSSGGHTHSYDAGVVTPPTCTAEGYTTYTCTDPSCGYSYKAEYVGMVDHTYENGTCSVCGAAEPAATEATLVTDVTSLQAGDRIIIVANGSNKALSTEQRSNNRGSADVTKTGSTVSYGDDTQIITLEAGTVSGTFAFNVGNGYLYAASSSSNYLRTGSLNANASWKIEITSSGVATIKAQGSNTRNWLRFNSSNSPQLFSCYTSGQADVAIYELPGCAHDWDAATCTAPKTCSLCGETEGDALGHNYEGGVCTGCGQVAAEVKTVKIYYPAGQNYITATASGNKLKPGTEGEAAVWTMTPDGDYYSFSCNGQYLTSGATGNSLTLASNLTDYALWALEEAANGYYLRNKGAVYNNKSQYIEYYNNLFTTYGLNTSNASIYTFQLKEIAAECEHSWSDANCTTPKTCSLCGATEGDALGHDWADANCTTPKTCQRADCGITEGEALGHNYENGSCTVCGEPDPNAGGSVPTTATITFDNVSKRTEFDPSKQVWQENGITVTNNKAASTSNVANYSNPARFYKGSEVIIAYPGMTKIEVTCNNTSYATALQNSITDGTVTVSGKVVTITLSAAADSYTVATLSAQVRVDSITVYAEDNSGGGDPDPNPSVPTTATITFDNTSKRTEFDNNKQVWKENGITVTNNKASSTNNVANYSNPARFYKGSSITIEYPGMTKIEVTCNSTSYASALKSSITEGTATVSGKVVTITLSAAADSYTVATLGAQVRVDSMTVYAEGGNSGGGSTECQHSWNAADCTTPKTCSLCGETEGDALGHDWADATCTEPKTCQRADCGITEGEALGHNYENGSCTVCGEPDPNAPGGATEAWTLVTDVSTLQVGDQIIIAAKGYNKALSTTQNGNNRGSAAITKDGETVTFGSDVQIITLAAGNKANTFAFNVGNGYLYAASSSKNYLRTETNLSNNSSWSISIAASGAATIKAQGTNTRNLLRFNSGNNPQLFACYASGQQEVVIYKLTVSTPVCQHTEWYEATCTDPKTCKSCGETEGEALGHDWAAANCTTPKTCLRDGCGLTEGGTLGHDYLSIVTVQPTCNEPGARLITCVNGCSDSYIMNVPATGHKMFNGTCTVCGATTETPDPVAVCGGSANCPMHDFSDLKADAWYHDGVHFCLEKGLIEGTPDGKLAPQENITRAQLVFALWRLEGSPVVDYVMDFADVAEGQWYTEAIRWAASQNLVSGYGNGKFGTNDEITREQFATVMYRYAAYEGRYLNFDGDLSLFDDENQISDYAVRALQWACGEGLIQGVSSEKLDPTGSATRAQAAAILYRYCEN